MTTYSAKIGTEKIAELADPGSPIGTLLDHVAAEVDQPDPDTLVFDEAVARVLRELPAEQDGHMCGHVIWFGTTGYPVEAVAE